MDKKEKISDDDMVELLRKRVTKQMPRDELEQHISEFLVSHNMCVLATSKDDVPRATPIEYHSKGTILYMVGDPSTKIRNIRANPQVSIGIHDPFDGNWLSVKGIQITGHATLITRENPEYSEALNIYNLQRMENEVEGRRLTIIKVQSKKIELTEIALRKRGYAARQVWEATKR